MFDGYRYTGMFTTTAVLLQYRIYMVPTGSNTLVVETDFEPVFLDSCYVCVCSSH